MEMHQLPALLAKSVPDRTQTLAHNDLQTSPKPLCACSLPADSKTIAIARCSVASPSGCLSSRYHRVELQGSFAKLEELLLQSRDYCLARSTPVLVNLNHCEEKHDLL